ncbi:amidohydrolase family protein [Jiangella alkaliphila]|uniref:Predicted metal-dependent hydrolase, TIM-barrel fold n=1 Tax=Jiangella alkaliphila TaxID=419479 RepID=A0A1H2LEN8_9ACTN|nr:amidohydrolase family protein [Jiangella alkaliphila]SDU79282.1 Predicted metal-dependent hydrolase, TIM-barrel fold [Jiangella alkaliphila]
MTRGGLVDFHQHVVSPSYVRRLEAVGIQAQPGIGFPEWSAESSLAAMDELGIEVSVLSTASPGFYFGDQEFATALCRDTNDELHDVVQSSQGRFLALAAVPLPSADSAIAEIERLLDVDGFAGVSLLSNYGGSYLGDPDFDAVLAVLSGIGALVHVHPTLPPWWARDAVALRPSLLEYVFDTSRSLMNLMLTGAHDRFPGIRWVFSHCGGVLPYVSRRLEIAEPLPELEQVRAAGVQATLSRFGYDCALSAGPAGLGSLLTVVPPSHVVFGSDFPFVDRQTIRAEMARLDAFAQVGGLDGLSANGRRWLGLHEGRAMTIRGSANT